ncbi:hypothetical protein ACFL5O_08585, partial [Myxococcota bacterium]
RARHLGRAHEAWAPHLVRLTSCPGTSGRQSLSESRRQSRWLPEPVGKPTPPEPGWNLESTAYGLGSAWGAAEGRAVIS